MRRRLRVWWDLPVRRIFPTPATVDDAALVAAYEYPVGGRWLRANMVASLDGAAQGSDGRSGTLASPGDKHVFQLLRAMADVILVGAGTARTERYGPALPWPDHAARRKALRQSPTPPIAVVSGRLALDPGGPLFSGVGEPTIVLTTERAPAVRRARIAAVADVLVLGEHQVDLASAVTALAGRGLTRMLCEGGPLLLGKLVAEGLVDELCLTFAPVLRGGSASRVLNGPPVPDVAMHLVHILEEDGNLITRWIRSSRMD
ncbi:MAG: pyrimidine reductase family protein [Jiangellaceae bacterium]|nr:pyrimidine reductase family protein [Jiangellaceae bacterium]